MGKYYVTKALGSGNTSKVYLGVAIDPNVKPAQVAIKILRSEFLAKSEDNLKSVQNEVKILQGLNHKGIVRLLDFGDAGVIVKPSGRTINKLVFLILEFVNGDLLFNACQELGAMGADGGRYFAL